MIRAFLVGLAAACTLSPAWAGDDPSGKAPAVKATTIQGDLKADDPKDRVRKDSPHKVHELDLKAGQMVVIRMKSDAFDAFLRIENSKQQQLAFNDDDGQGNNSRIVFKARMDDTYRIIATALKGGAGAYTLTIEPASAALVQLNALLEGLQLRQQQLNLAFQKAGEDEKAKIVVQFNNLIPQLAGRLVKLADEHPKDEAAVQALTLVLSSKGMGPNFDKTLVKAGDLLIRDHLQTKDNPLFLQRILMSLSQVHSPAAAEVLRNIIGKAPTDIIKGEGNLALGVHLRPRYEEAFAKKDAARAKELASEAEEALATAGKLLASHPNLSKQVDDALHLLTKLSVGKTAPDIIAEDIDGKPFKLSDYRGKVVALCFWGVWCPPCRAMIPHERTLVKRLEKEPFALIGVNSDQDKEKVKEFMEKEQMGWRHFWNGGSTRGPISTAWRVYSWPTIYVFDAEGVIRFRDVRGPDMDRAVDELLKEMANKK